MRGDCQSTMVGAGDEVVLGVSGRGGRRGEGGMELLVGRLGGEWERLVVVLMKRDEEMERVQLELLYTLVVIVAAPRSTSSA